MLTSVDPVNATLSTSSWVASMLPIAPLPVITLNTPGGRPASAQTSASSKALRRVYVAGFNTTVLPMARAGHTFQVNNMRGKFQGTMPPITPARIRLRNLGRWPYWQVENADSFHKLNGMVTGNIAFSNITLWIMHLYYGYLVSILSETWYKQMTVECHGSLETCFVY